MVIRCERCSTLYELDEGVLSPSGSQVQCTRCKHVFTAYPQTSAGRTLVGVPAQPEAPRAEARAEPAKAAASGAAAVAAPRAVRSAPPPIYRPAPAASGAAAPAGALRAPVLRKDTVGTFESRLRWSARWRWLGPVIVGLVLVGVGATWFVLSRRSDPAFARARGEALSLVALDDAGSLEEAVEKLEDVFQRTRGRAAVAADRSLAQVLRAATLVEEGEWLASRLATRSAERDRLRREQPAGWEEAERAAADEVKEIERGVKEREDAARALAGAAFETLRTLQASDSGGAEVSRALAAYYALGGDRERAQRAIRSGSERDPADPWLVLADAWLDARGPDRAARERALVKLGTLSAAHPELLRARYLLARTQAALGRRSEALATLEGLLASNGRHEGARRLREELSAPPPAPAPAAEKPAPPPPVARRRAAPEPGAPGEPGATAGTGTEATPLPPKLLPPAIAPRPRVREPTAPTATTVGALPRQRPAGQEGAAERPREPAAADEGAASATASPQNPDRPAHGPAPGAPPIDGG